MARTSVTLQSGAVLQIDPLSIDDMANRWSKMTVTLPYVAPGAGGSGVMKEIEFSTYSSGHGGGGSGATGGGCGAAGGIQFRGAEDKVMAASNEELVRRTAASVVGVDRVDIVHDSYGIKVCVEISEEFTSLTDRVLELVRKTLGLLCLPAELPIYVFAWDHLRLIAPSTSLTYAGPAWPPPRSPKFPGL